MAAVTKFSEEAILDAAEKVIVAGGIDGASIAAIARACGAPNGSIYHRFASRQHLIGALWVRIASEYRAALTEAITEPVNDLAEAIVSHTFAWVDENPSRAALLMRFRTEDFTPGDWPQDIIERIKATNDALASDLLHLAQRLKLNPLDVMMAVIDVPAAAARRSLLLQSSAATNHLRQRAIQLSRSLLATAPKQPPLGKSRASQATQKSTRLTGAGKPRSTK
jgi:AcrR family transcriptional regulator